MLDPPKEVQKVKNAFAAYESIPTWTPHKVDELRSALNETQGSNTSDQVSNQVKIPLRVLKSGTRSRRHRAHHPRQAQQPPAEIQTLRLALQLAVLLGQKMSRLRMVILHVHEASPLDLVLVALMALLRARNRHCGK